MRLSCQKVLILSALVVACSDGTAPRSLAGYYVLESVNGQPLPAIVYSEPSQTNSVISGTLYFDVNSDAEAFLHQRVVNPNATTEDRYAGNLSYRIVGNTIEIERFPPCPPNALCDSATFSGTVSDATLTLTVGRLPGDAPIVYLYRLAGGIALRD